MARDVGELPYLRIVDDVMEIVEDPSVVQGVGIGEKTQ
jgi:hypothetical protein